MVQCIRFFLCQCILAAIGYSIYYHDKFLCNLTFMTWIYSLLVLCLFAHIIIAFTKSKSSCSSVYLLAFHIPIIFLDFIGGAVYFILKSIPHCYRSQDQSIMVGSCIIFIAFNCLNLFAAACIMLSKRRRVLRRRDNENLSYLLDPPQVHNAVNNHANIQESHDNIEESQNLLWFKELKATRAMRELSCTVCLENFIPGEKFVELPCLHAFHPKCIKRWYMVDHSCPMCRRRLD